MRIGFSISRVLALAASALVAAFLPAIQAQSFDLDASRLPIAQVDSAWRFHLGDDPHWARPEFDDSNWPTIQPTVDWISQGYPRFTELAWFRFRLRAPAHTQSLVLDLPTIPKSYQLFSDGKLVAQVGMLPPGPAYNVIGADRVFTLPVNSGSSAKEIVVAIRIWQDPSLAGTRPSIVEGDVYAGEPDTVLRQFAANKAVSLIASGGAYTVKIVMLIVGAAAALLFWLTRERTYLWFAGFTIVDAAFFAIDFAGAHQAWSYYLYTYVSAMLDIASGIALVLFIVEALHPGKWKPAVVPLILVLLAELLVFLVLKSYIPLKWGDIGYCIAAAAARIVLAWYLIRGWRAGNLYAKLLFFPFAIDALSLLANNLGFALVDLNIRQGLKILPGGILVLHEPFEVGLDVVATFLSLLGMMSVLVYRFARTSREQQRLSAALKAAHDIQNRLVPVNVPTLGGLHTEIAYRAAEEVGGDFCQILPRPDGSIFAAIGDVSGKGLQAAMLGAVAVGALRSLADEQIEPAAVLERLNHVLLRTENVGFTTCLCLVLTSDGQIVLANAGHLAPYLDGVEIPIDAGLPLGILDGITYRQSTFVLPDNARLTLLSDGVVEARSRSGELFGFDRTSRASQLPASEIATIAHQFGQEDDITVITLDWRAAAFAPV
ncbi:MAG: SpoIIE family protein phosphatase [Terracidiphilus sp.]